MTPHLHQLHPYPFEKLARLKQGIKPPTGKPPVVLSIGEPQHATPHLISETLLTHLHGLSNYPTTKGIAELRQSIAEWLAQRFRLPPNALDPETQILPVNGTREALFAIAQCLIDASTTPRPIVAMPNPFYQIYEGAALLAGAEPYFLNTVETNGYLPDFDSVPVAIWQRCQLLYICSPGNPSGAVLPLAELEKLIALAERYDFVIASDECYSELYDDETQPPPGLLEAAERLGNHTFKRCLVFHSLSKRSNAPGLRSGFVSGDADLIRAFLLYRTYHGCAMPLPTQHASIQAWRDEQHVIANRTLYREKFTAVLDILSTVADVRKPPAGFYIWLLTPIADTEFAKRLFAEENVTVLPGSFLSRESSGVNPGLNHVRIALVATLDECVDAAQRIKRFIHNLKTTT